MKETQRAMSHQKGFGLMEVVVAMALFAIIGTGVYLSFRNLLDVSVGSRLKESAIAVVTDEIEIVRNLPYEDVGIVGGAPAGVINAQKSVTYGGANFLVEAFVRNIDDPFDGILGSTTNDTAPADYKLVEFRISCEDCGSAPLQPLTFTTIAAPRGLETATNNGNLFINVFDAFGLPIADADITVVNNVASPTVNIIDETNTNGILQLVDIPTSTTAYQITVSKAGHSSEQTYAAGDFGSSTPSKLHSTVAEQTITQISFAIDRTSTLNMNTRGEYCEFIGPSDFNLDGTKLVATAPDVLKYSQSHSTDAGGLATVNGLEWDTYNISNTDATYDFTAFSPSDLSVTLDPNESQLFTALIEAQNRSAVVVTVLDDTGQPEDEASVRLLGPGVNVHQFTGRRRYSETDWSLGKYSAKDPDIDADNPAGEIHLLASSTGDYPTSTTFSLTSLTKDLGTSNNTALHNISWNPETQSASTGPNSLRFQIASNNDNSSWVYLGPDGSGATYYASSNAPVHSTHNDDRYVRYRAYMDTLDASTTPQLTDIQFEFSSVCIPDGQVYFNGLGAATYTVEVSKATFDFATTSVSVSANSWNNVTISLIPS